MGKLVREIISINEKFIDEADPIKDMGIGEHSRIYQEIKDMLNELKKQYGGEFKLSKEKDKKLKAHYIYNKKDFELIYYFEPHNTQVQRAVQTGNIVIFSPHRSGNISGVFSKPSHVDMLIIDSLEDWSNKVKNELKRNLITRFFHKSKKGINEKFTEDMSDPINDMGIGGFSFDNLRFGAVIESKTDLSIAKGDKGNFTYMGKGTDMPKGSFAIVLNSRNYVIRDQKEIKIYVITGKGLLESDVEAARQNLKTNPNYSGWGTRTRLIINKKVFNSKFEVKEKGF